MVVTARHNAVEEQALAEQVGAGDQKAFRTLFDRYRLSIYRYCLVMLGDRKAAEDAYQDAFFAFYRACRDGKTMTNVRGYLLAVARSRCIDQIRTNRRWTALDEATEPSYEPLEPGPSLREQLMLALDKIPPQYREALVLFELKQYSYEEIAEVLGVGHHVVKNRIYRARLRLQALLRPYIDDEDFNP